MGVVTLSGEAPENEPDPEVIQFFQEHLDMALRGEIRSVAIGFVGANGVARFAFCTPKVHRYAQTAALTVLSASWSENLMDNVDVEYET